MMMTTYVPPLRRDSFDEAIEELPGIQGLPNSVVAVLSNEDDDK